MRATFSLNCKVRVDTFAQCHNVIRSKKLRFLILSDIHANLHALNAVLADSQDEYDAILCCGDLVGYGPMPNETVVWSKSNLKAAVRGNHDKVSVGLDDAEGYNVVASASLHWTAGILTEANKSYLREMPRGPVEHDGLWLMHGSPIDEDLYLLHECDAIGMDQYLPGPVNFFGHTHRQGGFAYFRGSLHVIPQVPESDKHLILALDPMAAYLINPGSVGQPRDGDWRAAYAIFSTEDKLLTFHRTEYNVEAAAAAIRGAGLPELLAKRLFLGK